MEIKSAVFHVSNTKVEKCPVTELDEFAFIGRSNVGKSSLINMLMGNKKLAKTSQSPGKTRLINHFLVNNQWFLVDLPGYGYAKVSKTQRDEFQKMINSYFLKRENLVTTFILVDSRLSPQPIDIEFMSWCGEENIPFSIVFTKTDKLTSGNLQKNIQAYKKELSQYWEELPQMFLTSATQQKGKNEILEYIDQLLSIE